MIDYNQLYERGEDYCIAAVKNWDTRCSKIIRHYLDTKSFLFPYEQRSRHMKLTLLLEAWIDEILMYYRSYHAKKTSVVKIDIDENLLCEN